MGLLWSAQRLTGSSQHAQRETRACNVQRRVLAGVQQVQLGLVSHERHQQRRDCLRMQKRRQHVRRALALSILRR